MKLKVDKKHRAKTNLPRRKTIIRSTESFCYLLERERGDREKNVSGVYVLTHYLRPNYN